MPPQRIGTQPGTSSSTSSFSLSTSVTSNPRSISSCAAVIPAMPAPKMTTRILLGLITGMDFLWYRSRAVRRVSPSTWRRRAQGRRRAQRSWYARGFSAATVSSERATNGAKDSEAGELKVAMRVERDGPPSNGAAHPRSPFALVDGGELHALALGEHEAGDVARLEHEPRSIPVDASLDLEPGRHRGRAFIRDQAEHSRDHERTA